MSDKITIQTSASESHVLNLIDDWGGVYEAPCLCIIGNEFGPTDLVAADSFDSCHEAWLDEQPTIPLEDVHEAYGFASKEEFCACEDPPDLVEGYEQQPNSTGTGIVSVSHYINQRKVRIIELRVV